jgi:hypothetical protein
MKKGNNNKVSATKGNEKPPASRKDTTNPSGSSNTVIELASGTPRLNDDMGWDDYGKVLEDKPYYSKTKKPIVPPKKAKIVRVYKEDKVDPNCETEIPILEDEDQIDTINKLDSIKDLEIGLNKRLFRDRKTTKVDGMT